MSESPPGPGTGGSQPILRFADFELAPDRFELWRGARRVALQPRVLDLLLHLVRNRDRVTSKAELLESVWGGAHVTEAALTQAVSELRRALGDDAARPRLIRTARGRGYRFCAEVETSAQRPAETSGGDPGSPFVGREDVLRELDSELPRALDGHSGLVLLTGEPGIGKTRTLLEFVRGVDPDRAEVLAVRCREDPGAPPYWPWIQVFRSYEQRHGRAALEALVGAEGRDLAPLLPRRPDEGARPPVSAGSAEEARFRLFDAAAAALRRAARAAPLVIALDDLHLADEPSLLLLGFLAEELAEAPALLLATAREAELERDPVRVARLSEMRVRRLSLSPLDRAEIERFAVALTGAPLPERLVEDLVQLSGGNPFFLEELLRTAPAAMTAPDGGNGGLPRGAQDAVRRHIRGLAPETQRVLGVAAVLGVEFGLGTLAACRPRRGEGEGAGAARRSAPAPGVA